MPHSDALVLPEIVAFTPKNELFHTAPRSKALTVGVFIDFIHRTYWAN
jgi:hypothetical protein